LVSLSTAENPHARMVDEIITHSGRCLPHVPMEAIAFWVPKLHKGIPTFWRTLFRRCCSSSVLSSAMSGSRDCLLNLGAFFDVQMLSNLKSPVVLSFTAFSADFAASFGHSVDLVRTRSCTKSHNSAIGMTSLMDSSRCQICT
jgi:hypothetical protein